MDHRRHGASPHQADICGDPLKGIAAQEKYETSLPERFADGISEGQQIAITDPLGPFRHEGGRVGVFVQTGKQFHNKFFTIGQVQPSISRYLASSSMPFL